MLYFAHCLLSKDIVRFEAIGEGGIFSCDYGMQSWFKSLITTTSVKGFYVRREKEVKAIRAQHETLRKVLNQLPKESAEVILLLHIYYITMKHPLNEMITSCCNKQFPTNPKFFLRVFKQLHLTHVLSRPPLKHIPGSVY